MENPEETEQKTLSPSTITVNANYYVELNVRLYLEWVSLGGYLPSTRISLKHVCQKNIGEMYHGGSYSLLGCVKKTCKTNSYMTFTVLLPYLYKTAISIGQPPLFWRQKSCTTMKFLRIKWPWRRAFFYCKIVFIIDLFTFLWIKMFLLLELYWCQLQQISISDCGQVIWRTLN